jgi:hypothetical protein
MKIGGTLMVENIYRRAKSLHEIRLQFIDDTNYCIQDSKGNRRDNPYLDLKRSQMEKEGPHPDFDLLCHQYELALHVLDRAEETVANMFSSQALVAIGFTSPLDASPTVIPAHHWHFLEVDFDEGKAKGEDLQYVGIKAIPISELSDEEQDSLVGGQPKNSPKAPGPVSSDTDPFVEYQEMEKLGWHEVSMSLLAGDHIEISAREKTKRVSYAHMGLVDKRIDKGILNRQGATLLGIAFKEKSKDSQYKKHLSRLRGQLKVLFGIEKNPFHPSSFPNLHFPIFELNDYRDKADQRAKERASRRTESYDDANIQHQLQGRLTSDLKEHEEEYPVDPDSYDGDDADKWLKNH